MNVLLLMMALAQDPSKPVMTAGVSVQMTASRHAVEMRAADELDVKVVAITAGGKVFHGVTPIEPDALSGIAVKTVYVKADARAPFQRVMDVLDALRGKAVVMLTAAPANAPKSLGGILPPYGVRLAVP